MPAARATYGVSLYLPITCHFSVRFTMSLWRRQQSGTCYFCTAFLRGWACFLTSWRHLQRTATVRLLAISEGGLPLILPLPSPRARPCPAYTSIFCQPLSLSRLRHFVTFRVQATRGGVKIEYCNLIQRTHTPVASAGTPPAHVPTMRQRMATTCYAQT